MIPNLKGCPPGISEKSFNKMKSLSSHLTYTWSVDSWMGDNEPNEDLIKEYMEETWQKSKWKLAYTEDQIDRFDFINEMLKSADIEFVVHRLQDVLGLEYQKSIVKNKIETKGRVATELDIDLDVCLNSMTEIHKELDKMMWYVSRVNYGDEEVSLTIEPIQSVDCTEYIMNNCDGKLYHICKKRDLKQILRQGLKTKRTNQLRFYTNRIYFVAAPEEDIDKCIKTVAEEDLDYKKGEYKILLVDLKKYKYNINIYVDSYTHRKEDFCFYTYAYFPPNFLEVYK